MTQKHCLCSAIPPHMLRNVARHADDDALRELAAATLDQMTAVAIVMRRELTFVPVLRIGRDAATGRFISVAEALRRPRTTIVQQIRYRPRPVPVRASRKKS